MRNLAIPAGITTAEETLLIPPRIEALVIQCTTSPRFRPPIPPDQLLIKPDYHGALDALKHLALRHAGNHGFQLVGHQECGVDLGTLIEQHGFTLMHWGVSPTERETMFTSRRDVVPTQPRVLTCLYFGQYSARGTRISPHDLALIKAVLAHPWGHAQVVGGDNTGVARILVDDFHDGAPLHIVHLQ